MKTTTERSQGAWFALVDADSCRLLCCSMTSQGTRHVDELDALRNTLPDQEHKRPVTGGGAKHSVENKERRFGTEIVSWIQEKAGQHKFDRLVIFAPPRMLGVLRGTPLGSLQGHVAELRGDLMRLNTGQLAKHPMVRELVMPQVCDKRAVAEPKDWSTPEGATGDLLELPAGNCVTSECIGTNNAQSVAERVAKQPGGSRHRGGTNSADL